MSKVRDNSHALAEAMHLAKIPQIIVGYLKLQQAKNHEFFNLFLQKKINGRLFYNTCMPNGEKELRYGNDDFQQETILNAIDSLIAPFCDVTLAEVRSEFVCPTELSEKMNMVITEVMSSIETTDEWKKFWEKEINLECNPIIKKQLYNTIASCAAYKALVSCIDISKSIIDPPAKRNVAVLIGMCTGNYQSPFLVEKQEFQLKNSAAFLTKRKQHDKVPNYSVFKNVAAAENNTAINKKAKKKKNIA